MVPWKTIGKTPDQDDAVYQRYCHVYKEGELESLCNQLPNVQIIKSFYDNSNWCVRIKKTM